MNDAYELKLTEFQGPIAKLLELIESRQLEITRVNLAEVTADFINYIKRSDVVPAAMLADFIVVAAKLILIKSHALLPSLETSVAEEQEMADLERRLAIYRELRDAERNIKKLWYARPIYLREFLADIPKGFYLSQPVRGEELLSVIARLNEEIAVIFPKEADERIKLVSLEETIRDLAYTINKLIKTSFNKLTAGKEKKEIVIMFLALLHLLGDNSIQIEQSGIFEDIKIVSQT
jgi:segregation and condensation protein A